MIDNIDENPWWGHSEIHCGHYHQHFIMFLIIRMIINIQFSTKHFPPIAKGWCLYENWGQLNGCVWELTRGQKLQERRWWGGHDHFDEEDMIILMRRTGLFWWGGQDYFDEEDRIICRIHKIAETLPVLFCWQSLVFYSSHCNKNYVWSWMEQPSLCRLQIHKLTLVHFFIL